MSAGSGVIVDAGKGYVITNHHVVDKATEIVVTLRDRRQFKAKLIGSDSATDIALVQIEADRLTAASACRLRQGPSRRLCPRHRQPLRPRADRDYGHCERAWA